MSFIRLILVLTLMSSLHAKATGGESLGQEEDLTSCSWVIALNPRVSSQMIIDEARALLERPDVKITNSVPYPYEPGEIISATFLCLSYGDENEAKKNLHLVTSALKNLKDRGLPVSCDSGTTDPRLGTGN